MNERFAGVSDHFFLEKGVAFCNHGSFGAVPKSVLEQKLIYDRELECNPDLWMRRTSSDQWLQNRRAIAPYFGTSGDNLAFVTNTTSGANAVLSSICWKPGDVIMLTDVTYQSVKAACEDVPLRHPGVEVRVVQLPYPVKSDDDYVQAISSEADAIAAEGKTPRLAIVDGISGMPAIRFPFEKIVKSLSQKSIEVFLDGAHCPGQIELDLDAIGADYFAGNLHKWFFSPKGTAVLYVAPKHQSTIRGPVVSIDNFKHRPQRYPDPLSARFFWQGTSQSTGFACVRKAIEFIDSLGGLHEIIAYNKELVNRAEELMLSEVADSIRFDIPDSFISPAMRNIFAPLSFDHKPISTCDMIIQIFDKSRVWVAGDKFHEQLFFRLSSQIYNTLDDYHKMSRAINDYNDLDY